MIRVKLDTLLAQKGLSVKEFAEAVGLTPVNVSILKNGRARAIRFSTLESICQVLECQPADVLEYVPTKDDSADIFDI